MGKRISSIIGLTAALALSTNALSAPLYSIEITGQVVTDNQIGDLGADLQSEKFTYNATFELDKSKATTRTNPSGYTVYQLNDGGNLYNNQACIEDNDLNGSQCISSNVVEFEYNNDLKENWQSELNWLQLGAGISNETALDALVFGFGVDNGLEFYATLLFEGDYFNDDTDSEPNTIDMTKYVGGGGEFALITSGDSVDGFAQFRIDSVSLAVPTLSAAWLFSAGLVGLIGMARRKKS